MNNLNKKIFKIYNNLTKKIEEINDFSKMTMYVCGPTLYDDLHVGNGRSLIIFDTFYRFFKFVFKEVIYVRNITDIDDKIIDKAIKLKKTPKEVVEIYNLSFRKILEDLNILNPTFETKATEFLPEMFDYISTLLKKKYAYITEKKNIYFSVSKLENYNFFQDTSQLKEEARVIHKDDKKNWQDFALWKNVNDNFGYDSPWGYGRPGWHLECSVMSNHYLGNNFLFHGGGEDLAFPHHHNEIAQGLGYCNEICSKIFVHNGLICFQGEKMSKSVGNILKINSIIKNKYDGDVWRYIFLSTSYSSSINLTPLIIENSKNIIDKIREFKFKYFFLKDINYKEVYIENLWENFNLPELFNNLFALLKKENYNLIMNTFSLLGFDFSIRTSLSIKEIEKLIEDREIAKKNKNYEESDKIRYFLQSNFIKIEDSKEKSIWFYM